MNMKGSVRPSSASHRWQRLVDEVDRNAALILSGVALFTLAAVMGSLTLPGLYARSAAISVETEQIAVANGQREQADVERESDDPHPLAEALVTLNRLLSEHQLELLKADQKLSPASDVLPARYGTDLMVQGGYGQIRAFLDAVGTQEDMSIEKVEMSRNAISEPLITASIVMSIYATQ